MMRQFFSISTDVGEFSGEGTYTTNDKNLYLVTSERKIGKFFESKLRAKTTIGYIELTGLGETKHFYNGPFIIRSVNRGSTGEYSIYLSN